MATGSKNYSEIVMSPGTITPEDLKPSRGESSSIPPIARASVLNQVPTLKTYKRKVSHLQAQQSYPKHGRPKGSTSSIPDALVPPDVHTKSLTPMSPSVEPGIPEDLTHYTSASPSSIPTEPSSVINLYPHAPPSMLLKPPMVTSLPRRIIAQRERRAREKLAKANIQLIHKGRVVPGTPEDSMPRSIASMATSTEPSSMTNQGCEQPYLATEALSSSSSSGLNCLMGKLLCCEGQLESQQPGKVKKNGDQYENLLLKIDPRTPAVEKTLRDAVKGLEGPTTELVKENEAEMTNLVKGNEAEKMAHQSDPSHAGPSSGKTIPFVKRSVLWKSIESLETFRKIPQNPCFRQLEKLIELNREATAIALMVNFDCLVSRVGKLCISDSQSFFNEMQQSLVTFEENGFDVGRIRSHIEELLDIRNNGKQFQEEKTTLQEQILGNTDEESRLDTRSCSLDKTIMELERQLASLHEERDSVYMQRMTIASETDKLQKDVKKAEKFCHSVEQCFNTIVSSPW